MNMSRQNWSESILVRSDHFWSPKLVPARPVLAAKVGPVGLILAAKTSSGPIFGGTKLVREPKLACLKWFRSFTSPKNFYFLFPIL